MGPITDVRRLWAKSSPVREMTEDPSGALVPCPLRGGLANAADCERCVWASEVDIAATTPWVRCNPPMRAILVGANEA